MTGQKAHNEDDAFFFIFYFLYYFFFIISFFFLFLFFGRVVSIKGAWDEPFFYVYFGGTSVQAWNTHRVLADIPI